MRYLKLVVCTFVLNMTLSSCSALLSQLADDAIHGGTPVNQTDQHKKTMKKAKQITNNY